MISYVEVIVYLVLGLMAGFLSGLLGVGGGLLVVPALFAVFHFLGILSEHTMQSAIATSLAAMVFTSMASAWSHLKHVQWSIFRELFPGIILGSITGAKTAQLIHTNNLRVVFGIFSLLIGFYFLLSAKSEALEGNVKPNFFIICIIGIIIGTISSIFGIGGGLITVPLLTLFGVPLRSAISTSAATGFLIAISGTLAFFYLGYARNENTNYIYVPAFLIIGLSACLTAALGAKYAYTTSTTILKRVLGIYQLVIGTLMIGL